MAAQITGAPPTLGPHSTFQEDADHWVHRIKAVSANTASLEVEGTKSWSSSFFSCFEPIDLCLITCCCPCVTFGQTHHRLTKDKNLTGYSPVNASCLGMWASAYCCLSCIPLMLQRNEIRKRGNLVGDTVTDLAKILCCACCVLIQDSKEAQHLLSTEYVTEQPAAVKQDMSYGAPATAHQNTITGTEYQHEAKVGV